MRWQILPRSGWHSLHETDPAVVKRVTSAVWQLEKLDLAGWTERPQPRTDGSFTAVAPAFRARPSRRFFA